MRALLSSTLPFALALVACSGPSSQHGPPPPTTETTSDAGSDSGSFADPTADPPPSDLQVVSAADPTGVAVAADFSCAGTTTPTGASGASVDRTWHVSNLGGQDTDRVPSQSVEIFAHDVTTGTPELTQTSDAQGTFTAKTPQGYVALHMPGSDAYYETWQLDIDTRVSGDFLSAQPGPKGNVDALALLVGGAGYSPTPGTSRVVMRVVDCKGLPVVGAHLALEIDGVVVPIVTNGAGVRRSYFGDNQLPSSADQTQHLGIVAFIEVPKPTTSLRFVARGRLSDGATPKVIASRAVPFPDQALLTGLVYPYAGP